MIWILLTIFFVSFFTLEIIDILNDNNEIKKKNHKINKTINDIKEYPPYDFQHIDDMILINNYTKSKIIDCLKGDRFGTWNEKELDMILNTIINDADNDDFSNMVTFKPKSHNKDFSYSLYRYNDEKPGEIWIGLHNIIPDPQITTCVLPQEERFIYYRIKDLKLF